MANRYFVQYLLNVGVISSSEAVDLLPRLSEVRPSLPLLALTSGLVTAGQMEGLTVADSAVFAEEAKEKKLLTASQVDNLLSVIPEADVCFAQLLLDSGKVDLSKLEQIISDYQKLEEQENPVFTAVYNRTGSPADDPVFEIYGKYAEMFILSTQRFINTEAVILPEEPVVEHDGVLVSQGLSGGMELTAGVKAVPEVFLELGRRYSGEELDEIDELAIDCVAEFLNVLNGLYIVNLSQLDLDVDLEEPHSSENTVPEATKLVAFRIATEFGTFVLYMAEDEFMC